MRTPEGSTAQGPHPTNARQRPREGPRGAVGGPMAFSGGVALGGAVFIDKSAALLTLTGLYAVVMPLLVWLGTRFDGVVEPEPAHV